MVILNWVVPISSVNICDGVGETYFIQFDFRKIKKWSSLITKFSYDLGTGDQQSHTFKLQYSADGSAWTDIVSETTGVAEFAEKIYNTITNDVRFRYVRFFDTRDASNNSYNEDIKFYEMECIE